MQDEGVIKETYIPNLMPSQVSVLPALVVCKRLNAEPREAQHAGDFLFDLACDAARK